MRKDKLSKTKRSRTMSRIKSKGTQFETNIFKALKRNGVKFQSHYKLVLGKPDIALPKSHKAVFLHSDFWHGWRLSKWKHVLPNEFWINKLHRNRKRDAYVLRRLRRDGWKVLVVWEHQIKKDFPRAINKISLFLKD